jgi:iron uptake system component EfeO
VKTRKILKNGLRAATLGAAAIAALNAAACGGDNEVLTTDADREEQAVLEVKATIQTSLDELHNAAVALQAAAPAPDNDGWNAESDAAAVSAMREEWKRARRAYEHVEGAIAVLFPDLDVSTDARYDAFIEVSPDENLFDDTGVTGAHAIERVLWSDAMPASVLAFESALPGYKAAAFPMTEVEALDFKGKLCARFVADTKAIRDGFGPLALDARAAYRGVIGSMAEQVEKINKASTGEEESRYAQFTLADMRANVAAGKETYAAFQGWLLEKGGEAGAAADAKILAGFDRIDKAYAQIEGDALPPVPEGWSSEDPPADLLESTPFGRLFAVLRTEADPEAQGSLVSAMLESADLLGVEPL